MVSPDLFIMDSHGNGDDFKKNAVKQLRTNKKAWSDPPLARNSRFALASHSPLALSARNTPKVTPVVQSRSKYS